MGLRKKIKRELIGTPDYPSNQIFTISNFITILRLILTFVFLYLFVMDVNRYVALVIYAVAASTDWLDGTIARKTRTVSWLGKMMDPSLTGRFFLPASSASWRAGSSHLGLHRHHLARRLSRLRQCVVRRYHKRPIDVVYTGKAATALLMTGFSFMLLGLPKIDGIGVLGTFSEAFPGLDAREVPLGIFFVYVGVIFSLLTAVIYTVKATEPRGTPSSILRKRT